MAWRGPLIFDPIVPFATRDRGPTGNRPLRISVSGTVGLKRAWELPSKQLPSINHQNNEAITSVHLGNRFYCGCTEARPD